MANLLIVIPTLDRSGAEKQFCQLAVGLSERGHKVEVIALNRGGPYEETLRAANIAVTILHKRLRFDFRVIQQLRALIRNRTPDVVLSCLFAANSATRIALYRIRKNRPKIIVSERCVDSWKSGWQLGLDRWLRGQTDLLIANSQSVADFYQLQGFPPTKIRIVQNGVAVPAPPAITHEQFCRDVNVPEGSKFIAFVGRLAPQKRIQDLLWAIQMLRHSRPDAYLVVIGDGPLKADLEEYARKVDADSQARFLGHRDDAASLLHFMDIFWLASEYEGMSNSLMEAMACGKPVVVSDIPANRELVEHGKDGWIVNLGDGAGFSQYTLKLLEDEQLRTQMGQAAKAKMAERFSNAAMIDQFEEIINSAAENR